MELKNMSKEEIELMSYTDLTYMILKENKKAMNTASLFKKICDLLEYSDDDFSAKVGDYYTSLTIDKRFYMLDGALWDLAENHKVLMEIDDDEEIVEDEIESDEEDEDSTLESDELDNIDSIDDDIDDVDDDTLDLSIVSEEELDEENQCFSSFFLV